METAFNRVRVGALNFEVCSLRQAVETTVGDALSKRHLHVHLANAWSIALANDDMELQQAFGSGRNYPDGKPVVWAMQCLRRGKWVARPGRVYGPAFFERVLERGQSRRVKHYFLGSTPETLEKLQKCLLERFPDIDIVGASSPPFKDFTSEDYAAELAKIEICKPQIVWVGLGTPKQDIAGAYMASRYPAVFACVGAAFDFSAGNLRDVPLWIQNAGLAWLFRFAQEPKRLWRRYTYGNAKFVFIVLVQLVKSRLARQLNAQ